MKVFFSDYFEILNSFADGCNNIKQFKRNICGIFQHDFCRSFEFEHNERLIFKDKHFGYFRLFVFFQKNSAVAISCNLVFDFK